MSPDYKARAEALALENRDLKEEMKNMNDAWTRTSLERASLIRTVSRLVKILGERT
jgi:hypothetical protein